MKNSLCKRGWGGRSREIMNQEIPQKIQTVFLKPNQMTQTCLFGTRTRVIIILQSLTLTFTDVFLKLKSTDPVYKAFLAAFGFEYRKHFEDNPKIRPDLEGVRIIKISCCWKRRDHEQLEELLRTAVHISWTHMQCDASAHTQRMPNNYQNNSHYTQSPLKHH